MRDFNILFEVDIHDLFEKALYSIKQNLPLDLILFGGDYVYNATLDDVDNFFNSVTKIAPFYGVLGNTDYPEIQNLLLKYDANLHARKVDVNGFTIIGFGGAPGAIYTQGFDVAENDLYNALHTLSKNEDPTRTILLTHAPPYNTKLDLAKGAFHIGSRALLDFIQEFQPKLCLCGHVHEAFGQIKIGNTICVNPGPAMYGKFYRFNLSSEI